MKILTLNTMINITSVGLIDSEKLNSSLHFLNYSDDMQIENLLPSINKLFSNKKNSLDLVEKIIVVNGVGSFTSARIAITVTKMLALVNKSKVCTIDTHDLLLQCAIDQKKICCKNDSKIIVAMSADCNRIGYYIKSFDSILNFSSNVSKISYFTVDEFHHLLLKCTNYTVVVNKNSELPNFVDMSKIVVIDDFSNVHYSMFKAALIKDCCDLSELKPLYVKSMLLKTVNGKMRKE